MIATGSTGTVGTVLTDSQGVTLYLNTKEKGGSDACMGSCGSVWPPVSVSHGTTSAVASGSSAQQSMLGTAKYGGGEVVTYNGYPLHTYTGDSAAGQANGQGLSGIWFAMTPSGTAASGSSAGGGSTSGNGGGGGGY